MKQDYTTSEEYLLRKEKLQSIEELGIDPYPHRFETTHALNEIQALSDSDFLTFEQAEKGASKECTAMGRLVLFRAMGKNAFGHIQEGKERLQVLFNRDHTQVEGLENGALTPLKFIEKKLDLGDIIGVTGHLFLTQKGEKTLYVKTATLLAKSLLPLADKYAGLADKETRYRKRWLDLISNDEVTETFLLRFHLMSQIRAYMQEHRFLEVETPVLQSIYGGAEAKPFKTTLNALDQEMFLRISLEIPLKKLIVGGFDRIFEMGKVFRNEGIDRNHNPEFTLLEAYARGWDYTDMMRFFENMCERLCLSLYGKTALDITLKEGEPPVTIDFKTPWTRMTMKEAIQTYAKVDPDALSDEEIRKRLEISGHIDTKKLPGLSRGLLIAALFEVEAEPHLVQPHHIIDHPIDTTPLCKLHRDPLKKKEGLVERFETFIACQEMSNSYSELNDPILQRKLLEAQNKRREGGDEEASPLDEEFIEAICQGMPPVAGIGIGIDRLLMLLTNTHSIRDILLFPWMKPLDD